MGSTDLTGCLWEVQWGVCPREFRFPLRRLLHYRWRCKQHARARSVNHVAALDRWIFAFSSHDQQRNQSFAHYLVHANDFPRALTLVWIHILQRFRSQIKILTAWCTLNLIPRRNRNGAAHSLESSITSLKIRCTSFTNVFSAARQIDLLDSGRYLQNAPSALARVVG